MLTIWYMLCIHHDESYIIYLIYLIYFIKYIWKAFFDGLVWLMPFHYSNCVITYSIKI